MTGGLKEPLNENVIKKDKMKTTAAVYKKPIKIDESLGSQEILADKSKSKLNKILGPEKDNRFSTKCKRREK